MGFHSLMRLRQKGGPIDRMEPSSRRACTRVRPLWDLAPGHALSGRSSLRLPAGGRSIAGTVAGGPGSIARSASSRSRRGSSLTASRIFGIISATLRFELQRQFGNELSVIATLTATDQLYERDNINTIKLHSSGRQVTLKETTSEQISRLAPSTASRAIGRASFPPRAVPAASDQSHGTRRRGGRAPGEK